MRPYRTAMLLAFLSLLTYALGLGMAHYLGWLRRWDIALLGMAWVALVIEGGYAVEHLFAIPQESPTWRAMFGRVAGLWVAAALVTLMLLWRGRLPLSAAVLQGAVGLGAFFWGAPPLHLRYSGYGEALLAAGWALAIPALAFALQAGHLHRLIGMVGLPLMLLGMAATLAWEFPDYAADLKRRRRTLLVRLDWRLALRLHHFLWVLGFFLLAVGVWLGLPAEVVKPCVVPLGAAMLQVWMMARVGQGARPPWKALRLNALLVPSLTAYLLALGFWRL